MDKTGLAAIKRGATNIIILGMKAWTHNVENIKLSLERYTHKFVLNTP